MSKGDKSRWALLTGGICVVGAAAVYWAYSSEQKSKASKKKAVKKTAAVSASSSLSPPAVSSSSSSAPTNQPAPPASADPAPAPVSVSGSANTTANASGELSREHLVAMFKDIVADMDALIFQLARREHQLRNKNVDKQSLLSELSQAYQESMTHIQHKAFAKYETTEQMAEQAVVKYESDPDFQQVRARMDLINNALMGGVPPPDPEQLAKQPDWLTVEKVIEIFTDMMEAMTQSMVESVEEVKAKHTDGPPPSEEVNQRYLEKITKVKDSVLLRYKLDEKMLDVAMLKYANDPTLANVMIELQTKQEKQFQELRKKVWGE